MSERSSPQDCSYVTVPFEPVTFSFFPEKSKDANESVESSVCDPISFPLCSRSNILPPINNLPLHHLLKLDGRFDASSVQQHKACGVSSRGSTETIAKLIKKISALKLEVPEGLFGGEDDQEKKPSDSIRDNIISAVVQQAESPKRLWQFLGNCKGSSTFARNNPLIVLNELGEVTESLIRAVRPTAQQLAYLKQLVGELAPFCLNNITEEQYDGEEQPFPKDSLLYFLGKTCEYIRCANIAMSTEQNSLGVQKAISFCALELARMSFLLSGTLCGQQRSELLSEEFLCLTIEQMRLCRATVIVKMCDPLFEYDEATREINENDVVSRARRPQRPRRTDTDPPLGAVLEFVARESGRVTLPDGTVRGLLRTCVPLLAMANVETLQLAALNVLRTVCVKYSHQRYNVLQDLIDIIKRTPSWKLDLKGYITPTTSVRISVLSEACLSLCTSAAGIPGVTTQPVHSFGDTNLTKNTFEMFVSLSSALVTAILDRAAEDSFPHFMRVLIRDLLALHITPEGGAARALLSVISGAVSKIKIDSAQLRGLTLDVAGMLATEIVTRQSNKFVFEFFPKGKLLGSSDEKQKQEDDPELFDIDDEDGSIDTQKNDDKHDDNPDIGQVKSEENEKFSCECGISTPDEGATICCDICGRKFHAYCVTGSYKSVRNYICLGCEWDLLIRQEWRDKGTQPPLLRAQRFLILYNAAMGDERSKLFDLSVLYYAQSLDNIQRNVSSAAATEMLLDYKRVAHDHWPPAFSSASASSSSSADSSLTSSESQQFGSQPESSQSGYLTSSLSTVVVSISRRVSSIPALPSKVAVQQVISTVCLASPFYQSLDDLLGLLLQALLDQQAKTRARALRSLSEVLNASPGLLGDGTVRASVCRCLGDPSALVREVAVGIIGDHIFTNAEIAERYYQPLLGCILDPFLSVRKHALQVCFDVLKRDTEAKHGEMCRRILSRLEDEQQIQKLVTTSFEELWFSSEEVRGLTVQQRVSQICKVVIYPEVPQLLSRLIEDVLKTSSTPTVARTACSRLCSELAGRISVKEHPDVDAFRCLALLSEAIPEAAAEHFVTMTTYIPLLAVRSFALSVLTRALPYVPSMLACGASGQALARACIGLAGSSDLSGTNDALKALAAVARAAGKEGAWILPLFEKYCASLNPTLPSRSLMRSLFIVGTLCEISSVTSKGKLCKVIQITKDEFESAVPPKLDSPLHKEPSEHPGQQDHVGNEKEEEQQQQNTSESNPLQEEKLSFKEGFRATRLLLSILVLLHHPSQGLGGHLLRHPVLSISSPLPLAALGWGLKSAGGLPGAVLHVLGLVLGQSKGVVNEINKFTGRLDLTGVQHDPLAHPLIPLAVQAARNAPPSVRAAAANFLSIVAERGLDDPSRVIGPLLGLCGDTNPTVSSRARIALSAIAPSYPSLVISRIPEGIKAAVEAYKNQSALPFSNLGRALPPKVFKAFQEALVDIAAKETDPSSAIYFCECLSFILPHYARPKFARAISLRGGILLETLKQMKRKKTLTTDLKWMDEARSLEALLWLRRKLALSDSENGGNVIPLAEWCTPQPPEETYKTFKRMMEEDALEDCLEEQGKKKRGKKRRPTIMIAKATTAQRKVRSRTPSSSRTSERKQQKVEGAEGIRDGEENDVDTDTNQEHDDSKDEDYVA